jgi:hypothetical protein
MLIHWDLEADLLFEGQGHDVRLHFLMLKTALQVGIIVAPAPAQPVAIFVKPKTWYEDEIKSSCGKEEQI